MQLSKKGHIMIPVTRDQLVNKLNGSGLCDFCNTKSDKGFLIPVLNDFYCIPCTKEFEDCAEYNTDDTPKEIANFKYFTKKLRG